MSTLKITRTPYGTGLDEGVRYELDGRLIAAGGYGGEPEDNSRQRDYHWVDHLTRELCQAAGINITVVTE